MAPFGRDDEFCCRSALLLEALGAWVGTAGIASACPPMPERASAEEGEIFVARNSWCKSLIYCGVWVAGELTKEAWLGVVGVFEPAAAVAAPGSSVGTAGRSRRRSEEYGGGGASSCCSDMVGG